MTLPGFQLSRLARLDLIEISDYTQEVWGDEQAARYIDGLEACFRRLVESPEMGRPCDQIRPGFRRVEHGKHVIVYRAGPDGIFIGRILHQRMIPNRRVFEGE